MPLLSYIRATVLANHRAPCLRKRLRALHVNRRLHTRRPFLVTLTRQSSQEASS
jgi:hypothetical protein